MHVPDLQADLNLAVKEVPSVKIRPEVVELGGAVMGNNSPSFKIVEVSDDTRNIEASEELRNLESFSGNSFLKK